MTPFASFRTNKTFYFEKYFRVQTQTLNNLFVPSRSKCIIHFYLKAIVTILSERSIKLPK